MIDLLEDQDAFLPYCSTMVPTDGLWYYAHHNLRSWDLIGEGRYRRVHGLCAHLVLKVEKVHVPQWQSEAECRLYESLDDAYRNLFARIYARSEDYRLLIQERVDTGLPWISGITKVRAAVRALGVVDVKSDNFGKRKDGTLVVCDWGVTKDRKFRVEREREWRKKFGDGSRGEPRARTP